MKRFLEFMFLLETPECNGETARPPLKSCFSLPAILALYAIPTPQLSLFPPAMIPAHFVPWLRYQMKNKLQERNYR